MKLDVRIIEVQIQEQTKLLVMICHVIRTIPTIYDMNLLEL